MQRVGCQNMDRIDPAIFEQFLIISCGAVDSNAVAELSRSFGIGSGHRRDLDMAQPAQVLRMNFSHETSSDQGRL